MREILRAMGEDVTREGLLDTPARVAKALTFAMRGYGTSATVALGTAQPSVSGHDVVQCAHAGGAAYEATIAPGGAWAGP